MAASVSTLALFLLGWLHPSARLAVCASEVQAHLGEALLRDDACSLSASDSPLCGAELLQYESRKAPQKPCSTSHVGDIFTPVHQVLAAHPGVDGWCHFGFLGDWMRECGVARQKGDYAYYGKLMAAGNIKENQKAKSAQGSALLKIQYEGGTIFTDNYQNPHDDVYCHANGWLQGQGNSVDMESNYTQWAALARKQCDDLEREIPESAGLSMGSFLGNTLFKEMPAVFGSAVKSRWGLPKKPSEGATLRDLRKHAAFKCTVGDVGCDMAFCLHNGCLRDGNVVRHGEDCHDN